MQVHRRDRISGQLATLLALVLVAEIAGAANVSVSPSSGAGGMQVSLTSSGFDVDGIGFNTAFYVDNAPVGGCPPTSRANCTIQLNIPAYTPGAHTVSARNSNNETADTTYTVVAPAFRISPGCGPPGTTVTAIGHHFAVGADVGIYFNGALVVSNNYPDASGGFEQTFDVPSVTEASYEVEARNSLGTSLTEYFALAAECAELAQVASLSGGGLEVQQPDGSWTPLAVGDHIRQNDRVRAPANGGGKLVFPDDMELRLPGGSDLRIDDYIFDAGTNAGRSSFSLLGGLFSYVSGLMSPDPGEDNRRTDMHYGTLGIRGTSVVGKTNVAAGRDEIYLVHGTVAVTPWVSGLTGVFDAPLTIFFDDTTITTSPLVDTDADEVPDPGDNCADVANAGQLDADGDGYGNACDADLNNSGLVTATDFNLLRSVLNQSAGASPLAAAADMNGSGLVTATDFNLLRARLNTAPGPSGLAQ